MPFNILVPTDFSSTAEKAFMYALDVALKCKGTVFLYHVYTPLESPFIETVSIRREYNLENEKSLMNDLHAMRNKWAQQYPTVKVITVLGSSPLVGSLLKLTLDRHISLIVMGTQGASGLKKVIVGTIAGRIVEKTTIPLLLVPERFEWEEPKKIVLATNYHPEDSTALLVCSQLASLYNAFIEVVHLTQHIADSSQAQAVFDQYLVSLKMELPHLAIAASLIPVSSVVDGLESLHQRVPYDMLVMVRHQKKFLEKIFLESCTKHMAYLTWKPLLVIPGDND